MVEIEFWTSSAFRGWVRVRVLGYGFGVRNKNVIVNLLSHVTARWRVI